MTETEEEQAQGEDRHRFPCFYRREMSVILQALRQQRIEDIDRHRQQQVC